MYTILQISQIQTSRELQEKLYFIHQGMDKEVEILCHWVQAKEYIGILGIYYPSVEIL